MENRIFVKLSKKYRAVLKEKGVPKEKIRVYGVAFKGKEVSVDGGYLREFERALFINLKQSAFA